MAPNLLQAQQQQRRQRDRHARNATKGRIRNRRVTLSPQLQTSSYARSEVFESLGAGRSGEAAPSAPLNETHPKFIRFLASHTFHPRAFPCRFFFRLNGCWRVSLAGAGAGSRGVSEYTNLSYYFMWKISAWGKLVRVEHCSQCTVP